MKSNIGDDSGDTCRNIIRVPCHTALLNFYFEILVYVLYLIKKFLVFSL